MNRDKSDYCQRWQLYLTLQDISRDMDILGLINGTEYLVWYFRALGSTIGKNVCLYPNGGDPMMTEPDMVTLGDGVSVDEASIICHINTRGNFSLNPLFVGSNSVLRSHSRLLSGAVMEDDSMMLEHTLVMSGESVDKGTAWQGWPARNFQDIEQHQLCIADMLGGDQKHKRFCKRHSTYVV